MADMHPSATRPIIAVSEWAGTDIYGVELQVKLQIVGNHIGLLASSRTVCQFFVLDWKIGRQKMVIYIFNRDAFFVDKE